MARRLLAGVVVAAALGAAGAAAADQGSLLRSATAVRFVQVEAIQTGGVTDCPPKLRNCNEHWSNVRRILVPRPS
jgi:hypothetical protein